MIKIVIKNDENNNIVLTYSKGDSKPFDLLTIGNLGLPTIATSDSRKSYAAIDYLRKVMRDEDLDSSKVNITVDEDYNCNTNQGSLNTMFKYLNKELEHIDIIDRKICFSNKRSA